MQKPLHLYRRWRSAAGLLYSSVVPAAPFSQLGNISNLDPLTIEKPEADTLTEYIAVALANSEIGKEIKAGKALAIIDLPGALSAGVGAYLQIEGIAPVLLFAAFYRPGAFLDGVSTLQSLFYYGNYLGSYGGETGFAFLLERERIPVFEPGNFAIMEMFDNRYALASVFFPPFQQLLKNGIQTLVDVRPLGQEVSPDLLIFYEEASQAGFSVLRSHFDLELLQRSVDNLIN